MVLVGVARQEREPGRVGLRDSPAERVLVSIADLEVVVEPAELRRMIGHLFLSFVRDAAEVHG